MARKLIYKNSEELEKLLDDCLIFTGFKKLSKDIIKLLIRLVFSKIGYYFFLNPDDVINVGFMQVQKSPDKDELFKVKIIRDAKAGVINADTLQKFYNGDLAREKNLKETLTDFLSNLINYAQEQEEEITNSINLMETKRK